MKSAETTLVIAFLLALSASASRLTSSPSHSVIAKQKPNEQEFPVDDSEKDSSKEDVEEFPSDSEEVDKPGNGGDAAWDPICPREGSGAVCMDCSKISVCLRGKVLPARDCPRNAPYCVNSAMGGHCSAKPDDEREDCRSDFQCSSEGYFPDPHNCNFYYMCDSDLNAVKFDCMPGYVYDMVSKNCRRQIFAQECKKLECAKSNGVWVYYDTNKQYYGYCYESETGSEEVVLFKCSDGAEFDGHQCQFKCRSEGKFADTQDHTRYFECYYVGFTLHSRLKTCIKGMMFDANTKFCKSTRGFEHH